VADKVISQAEFDNAQMTYEHAEARLRSLEHQVQQEQVQLHYYQVKAPMAGIVGDIPVRVGDRVSVSTLLTTVDEPGALEAYIYVPASRASELHVGLPVKLLDEKGNVLVDTKITFVSPQADQETQTVLAKAAVPNAKASLRTGAPVLIVVNDRRDLYPEILDRAGLQLEERLRRHVNRRTGRRAGEFFEDVLIAR